MVRRTRPITVAEVNAIRTPGRHSVGGNLIVNVTASGTRSWVVRLCDQYGKAREFGIGTLTDVTLADARERAREFRNAVRNGEALLTKRQKRQQIRKVPTFANCARQVHEERGGNWRNGKHVAQWIATLETYAFPIIGEMLVDEIKASHVLDILNPIWRTKSETARRLKQRILVVLNWAQVREYRSSGIPAKAISDALGKSAERGANHFTALPYAQIPAVVAAIKGKLSMGSLGLYALILTAARSNEIRNAVRGEICFESQTWTIPAGRMKAGKEHTVHLTDATMEVFRTAMSLSHHNELIFPGARTKPMSDATILKALRQCGVPVDNATVHGFRSSFYDWASENMPHIPDAVVDAALAHQVSDKVKKAYKRTNFSEMRKELLGAWSDFCSAGHKANGEVRT